MAPYEFNPTDPNHIWKTPEEEEEEEKRRRERENTGRPEKESEPVQESWLKKIERQIEASKEKKRLEEDEEYALQTKDQETDTDEPEGDANEEVAETLESDTTVNEAQDIGTEDQSAENDSLEISTEEPYEPLPSTLPTPELTEKYDANTPTENPILREPQQVRPAEKQETEPSEEISLPEPKSFDATDAPLGSTNVPELRPRTESGGANIPPTETETPVASDGGENTPIDEGGASTGPVNEIYPSYPYHSSREFTTSDSKHERVRVPDSDALERARRKGFGQGLVVGGLFTWLYQRNKREKIIRTIEKENKKHSAALVNELNKLRTDLPDPDIHQNATKEKYGTATAPPYPSTFLQRLESHTNNDTTGTTPDSSYTYSNDRNQKPNLENANTPIANGENQRRKSWPVNNERPFSAINAWDEKDPSTYQKDSAKENVAPPIQGVAIMPKFNRPSFPKEAPAFKQNLPENRILTKIDLEQDKNFVPFTSPEVAERLEEPLRPGTTVEQDKKAAPLSKEERIMAESPEFDLGIRRLLRTRQSAWRTAGSNDAESDDGTEQPVNNTIDWPHNLNVPKQNPTPTQPTTATIKIASSAVLAVVTFALALIFLWMLVR